MRSSARTGYLHRKTNRIVKSIEKKIKCGRCLSLNCDPGFKLIEINEEWLCNNKIFKKSITFKKGLERILRNSLTSAASPTEDGSSRRASVASRYLVTALQVTR